MTRSGPMLEADGIGRAFGRKVVLKSAGLQAWPGRITALMGRNGIGKSTLLKIVIGKVRADYGRIVYRGEFQSRPSLARLARAGLMYVGQESVLTPIYTVRQHVEAFARTFRGDDRAEAVLDRLRLNDLLDRRPFELSGGERRRVSLALALIRRPSCLLADEPFAGVAPGDRITITAALEELRTAGAALVITGHDVEDLFHVSDRIVWMVSGTTHVLGSPEAAAKHFQFRREYLGPRGA